MLDHHIDPALRDDPGVASLSPAHLVSGELIPRNEFSAQLYVHSRSVVTSDSDARREVLRPLESNRSSTS
jgi:hypothetical protein